MSHGLGFFKNGTGAAYLHLGNLMDSNLTPGPLANDSFALRTWTGLEKIGGLI
jgi:hypothetical protein